VNDFVSDVAQEFADAQGVAGDVAAATAALGRCRTNLATDSRQRIGPPHQGVGVLESSVLDKLNVAGDVHIAGANVAARCAAVEKAAADAEVAVAVLKAI
jgi:hypothetical protein